MLPNDEPTFFNTDSYIFPGLIPNNSNNLDNSQQLSSSAETLPEDDEILRFSSEIVDDSDETEVNIIEGTDDDDILIGTDGDDIINSSWGEDTITGGDGNDTFVYLGGRHVLDIITDFEYCHDRLDLTGLLDDPNVTIEEAIESGYFGYETDGEGTVVVTEGHSIAYRLMTLQGFTAEEVNSENFLTDILTGSCSSNDREAPVISAELLNDTGEDDTDNITSDPTIKGTVTDESEIVSLKAGFNDTPTSDFIDITAEISEDGTFELNQQLLEEILGDTLTNDTYTLKLQATDEHNNSSEISEFTFTLDTETSEIQAELLNDTGASDTDEITSDPTIKGTVTDNNDISSLVVSFNQQNLEYELKDNLDTEGNFELTKEILEEIKGEDLESGTHTLYFQAIDNADNTSEIYEYSFTLDTTTELTIELDTEFDTPPTGDNITEAETVTLSGQTEPNQTVTLEETGEIVTADEEGKFEFVEVELEIGENLFNATVEDDAGNQETAEITITRDEIILIENDNFNPTKTKTIEIPETSSQLNINIADIAFDTTDNNNINDAFELSLIDENGFSLVHTIKSERNSFFNLTEGETPTLAAGVEFDGETITLDLSQLTPGIQATLQAKLINNDSDTETTVHIREIKIEATSSTTPPINTPESPDSTATEIDFDHLSDVSGMVATEYLQTSLNDESNILYVDLATESATENPLRGTLLLGISNLNHPSIRVIDADGTTPEELPYYNLTDTGTETVAFYNPQGLQFDYELVFLGELNIAPEFASDADVEAIVGRSYIYEALAVDADGDELSYSLMESPVGMSIDEETGEIVWSPTVEDVGTHGVRVRVEDEVGAFAEQNYVLSVVEGRPNRSPVWGSLPVVDASVNGDYVYDAVATDADGDVLSFSLVEAPEGMEVDEETGVVSWVPVGEQVGVEGVVLRVSDGNGGVAEQEFGIFVRQEEGNREPIIVSEPETEINVALNTSPWEDVVFGIKSHGVAGEPHPSKMPAHLFSLPADGSEFTDIGLLTLDGEQIDADGLAISRQYGLLAFQSTPNDSTLISINPDTAVATIVGESLVGREIRGAVFDRSDNLWALDSDNDELLKIDPEAGNVLESKTLMLEGEQFNLSDTTDIAISADGTFYAISDFSSRFFTLDPEAGVLTYEATGGNQYLSGLTFSGAADESQLFAYDVYGSEEIYVYDLDNSYSRSMLFSNIIPSFNAGRGDLAALIPPTTEYQYPVEAIDPDEDVLAYSLETAPDGMTIDPNTGEIIWNPTVEELYQTTESSSEQIIFFGEDISNLGDSSRLPTIPNSDDARDAFLSKLVGVETEDFESFAHNERPSNLTFGADTAAFLGRPNVRQTSSGTYNGTFPTSGDKSLFHFGSAGSFQVEFSHPQAAFGFYATDVGDGGGTTDFGTTSC
ncbi:MAG: Ig-like domain-containing protein [Cyanobacteriota bacterium]|nr:Ig-like domain-containing protein [Cyanobacteriota bacterium]